MKLAVFNTFTDSIISRHRTMRGAVRAEHTCQPSEGYIPTAVKHEDGTALNSFEQDEYYNESEEYQDERRGYLR